MAVNAAVLGYASADRCVAVDAFAPADGTAVVRRRLSHPWPRLGGCGPQVAAQLAGSGVRAACLTWVAPDAIGRALTSELEASGADTGGVEWDGTRTAESFIVYDAGGRAACYFDPGDAAPRGLSPAQRERVAGAGLVCLTVGPALATSEALDALAPEARLVWSVKADPDAYPPWLVGRLLERADVVAYSAGERGFVRSGGAAATVREDAVMIETHGAAGVRWRRRGDSGWVPVDALAVRDATGAGDALVAGLIAGLLRDFDDVPAAVAAGIATSRALLERRREDPPA